MEIILNPSIKRAADLLGGVPAMASVCNVSTVAVYKWLKKGRLPRTEWTGETTYSQLIEQALAGKITRAELLQVGNQYEQSLKTEKAAPPCE